MITGRRSCPTCKGSVTDWADRCPRCGTLLGASDSASVFGSGSRMTFVFLLIGYALLLGGAGYAVIAVPDAFADWYSEQFLTRGGHRVEGEGYVSPSGRIAIGAVVAFIGLIVVGVSALGRTRK